MACSSRSPVRMRATVSTGRTKIFPSPILSVRADSVMARMQGSARSSATTTSISSFGRKSTTYSAPRYSSVRPFRRPNPLASETVIPATPSSDSASRTSSRRKGSMMATMRFMRGGGLAAGGGGRSGIVARSTTRA